MERLIGNGNYLMKYNLGALPNKEDKRDILLGRISPKVQIPESYITNSSLIKTLYQDKYPMCGSHAGSLFKAWHDIIETGTTQNYSPVYLWKKIKAIDGYAPEMGTDMRSIFKVLSNTGVCDYNLLPTDYTLSLEEQTKDNTNEEQNENAHPRIIKSYAQDSGDIQFLKEQIYLHKLAIVLANVGNTWWGKKEVVPFTKMDGGHFFVAYGYDKDGVFVVDSADKDVPFKHISNDYVIRAVGTAVDLPNWQVTVMKKHIFILKQIVELLIKLKKQYEQRT